jgi:Flp pilus assembly protein TadD/mono/diheme cytochrome c family protein
MSLRTRLSIGVAMVSVIISSLRPATRAAVRQPSAPSAVDPSPVTFSKDVAPILFERCAPCHRADSAAPFPLLTFVDARSHAAGIIDAISSRHMPPWLPKHGGPEFAGERRLSDDEIALIERWVRQGAREGDPIDLPPVPRWPAGWQQREPDLVLEMPESFQVPASAGDVYRNFVLPVSISERRYVRAVELWPDNPAVVHHAVITIDRTRWSRYRDAQDSAPGYDGMLAGQAESPSGHFLAWTPGRTVMPEPDDMAWRLDRGDDLVLQLHIMPAARPQSVRVKVGLFFTGHPPTRFPVMLRVGPKNIDIAAGNANYVAEDEYTVPVDVDALAVYPHAHYLARTMTAVAHLPDGSVRSLLDIPRWDFHWQDQYRYVRPIALPRGTTIAMRFVYDNSGRDPHHPSQRVVYGPRSSDEMSDLWLQLLPHSDRDRDALQQAQAKREALADIAGYETLLRVRPHDAVSRGLLGSLYAHAGRWADADRAFRAALLDAPDDWLIHFNLGAELQSRGRSDEAEAEYRSAVRVNPLAAEAHHALGMLRYTAGRFTEAIDEFRVALQIWPDYADASTGLGSALAKSGRIDSAVAAYRDALAVDPDHIAALNDLGILLVSYGELDEAIRLLSHAVALAPSRSDSRQNLAAALAIRADRAKRR